ncbi:PRC-barrel domain containing protein [Collinsella sp. zg1085]|uniref:PRC-barrel domain containing protein n=1 Tax=Collinsella sp. zg1085 TaxID=2844380 RepID=UPI001C0CE475|nr:PRC-barrel domain containing protein [Collinsella sp. zg1085]QWT17786.1 PRC-barrel domain containing protein [Collinsella sp. zg1085]
MRVQDFQGTKLYRALRKTSGHADEAEQRIKKLGKIHHPVFSPDGRKLVGFMVSLPDIVGMFKQADRFVAFDAVQVIEGSLVVSDKKDSYDTLAAQRLGVDLETCIIWTGMDVVTESGRTLGYCADADCHPKTGAVNFFAITASAASSALIGNLEMPASYLKGYRSRYMIVSDKAQDLEFSGGAAAVAAAASTRVSAEVKKGAAALDEHGSRALDEGSKALGKQLGRAKGMFGAFVSEYKQASKSSE